MMVVEKALAKVYGGYHKIPGDLILKTKDNVSFLLEDLTGGYTEKVDIKNFNDNIDFYW
jgi:hypothetical protein